MEMYPSLRAPNLSKAYTRACARAMTVPKPSGKLSRRLVGVVGVVRGSLPAPPNPPSKSSRGTLSNDTQRRASLLNVRYCLHFERLKPLLPMDGMSC